MQLRKFIKKEVVIEKNVSAEYEIARILQENQEKTVFFERVKGYDFRVVGNVTPSRESICASLGTSRSGYINTVLDAVSNPVEPVIAKKGECYEVRKKSLNELPILKHFEKDAGKYITSGIVIARDPEYGRNVSVHRMLVLNDRRMAARLVERHLYLYHQRAERRNEALEVAIAIGVHPAILFAASYSPPLGYDEFRLASSLLGRPVELVKCKTVDAEVPRYAEIVIEGKILPKERVYEGPFADITGTYDIARKQPIIEVSHIAHRKQPIYHALLNSGMEHRLLMGMPQEPKIYGAAKKNVDVKNVCLTEGGCNWLHGVVAISKRSKDDGKKAIHAALEAHPSMKHVVIVDEDIDIFDANSIEFAIATRFQAGRDAVVIKNVRGSSLDPSASKTGLTAKVGIDATIKDRKKDFERAKVQQVSGYV